MSIRISADALRSKAIEAMKLMDADGFAIGGNEGAIAITLTFDRRNAGAGVANEARGDTEVSPPRRSWRRWAKVVNGVLFSETLSFSGRNQDKIPITVIEGHIDLAEIERDAYERGWVAGFGTGQRASAATPQPIAGVEQPVFDPAAIESCVMSAERQTAAAVSRAYEIDGVRDLLDAVEASLVIYTDPSSYVDADHNLRAAAARVREAMGAATPAAGQGEDC